MINDPCQTAGGHSRSNPRLNNPSIHPALKLLFYQDYLRVGGTEAHTIHQSQWACDHGHSSVILTNRPGGRLADTITRQPVRVRSLQPFQSGINFWAPGWSSAIRQEKPDAIILMGRVANCMGNAIRDQFPKIPVIASLRTGRHIPLKYRESLMRAGKIIVNSGWAAERAKAIGIDPSRVSLVYNPFLKGLLPTPDEHERQRASIRSEAGCHPDQPVILCVASFVPGKNQEGLLNALRNLKPDQRVEIWFVGEGARMKHCQALAKTLPSQVNARFWGHRKNVTPFYCGADLAVSASLEESLPNFLVEAQYHGLPVVAYDEAGVKECFIDGTTGVLIPRDDSAALASAIRQWLRDGIFQQDVASSCRAFAQGRFDPNRQSHLWLDLVLEFASRH